MERDRPGPPDPPLPDPAAALTEAVRSVPARNRGLRLRLIMVVVAVCGAAWLSTLFETLRDRTAALDTAVREHDNVAGALAEQAARSLQATDLILQQAALLDPDRPGSGIRAEAVPELLRRHMSGVPQVRSLFLSDPGRRLTLSTASPPNVYIDILDRSYLIVQREHPAAGLFLSEPFISRATGEPTFVLSRRLPGEAFRGIVGASVSIGYFRRFYQALQLGSGSTVELLRTDGTTLVSRESAAIEAQPSAWQDAVSGLGTRESAHLELRPGSSGAVLVSLRRVSGFPAVIAVARSTDAILSDWRHEAWTNALRTFAITGLAALLLVAFLRQLDRHERITAQLHQSQKLEALGTLAGGIAHDFNNILGAVLGYAELAAQRVPPQSSERRYVDNIVLAAHRARDLVARILAFSRPAAGPRDPLVLQDIVRETAGLLRASLPPDTRLELTLADAPLVVLGDGALLHQVVANLLTNAAHALPHGGSVQVRLDRETVAAPLACTVGRLAAARYARLDVHDAGVGIPPDQLSRIFDPFYTTKRIGEGTGLGLSLVHGIVLDHGGAIEVESRPGVGTTFRVFLPLTDAAPGSASPPPDCPRGAGQTVLVVDDEEALVHLAEELLASLGYEPVGCVGPEHALATFRADPGRFDAALCDVLMPGMAGTRLAAELHALRPELPVLLISGYAGPGLQREAEAAGARALLHKPIRAADLARSLADLFNARTTAPGTDP